MKIQVLNDVEILQQRIGLDRQGISAQLGKVDVVVGADEIFVGFPLCQEGDFFIDRTVYPAECMLLCVIDLLGILRAEP